MGLEMSARERERVARSIRAFLDEHADTMRLVRIRLYRAGHKGMVRCKLRAWQEAGPTVVVSSVRPTLDEAVVEAAENLERAIDRRAAKAGEQVLRRRVQRVSRRLHAQMGGSP
jgi:methylmalonyl-CoA mutase cobalamin-binding subunit